MKTLKLSEFTGRPLLEVFEHLKATYPDSLATKEHREELIEAEDAKRTWYNVYAPIFPFFKWPKWRTGKLPYDMDNYLFFFFGSTRLADSTDWQGITTKRLKTSTAYWGQPWWYRSDEHDLTWTDEGKMPVPKWT